MVDFVEIEVTSSHLNALAVTEPSDLYIADIVA